MIVTIECDNPHVVIGNRVTPFKVEVSLFRDGKSAYQYAVDAGYTGTEEEFTMLMVSPEFTIAEQEAQTDWDNIN